MGTIGKAGVRRAGSAGEKESVRPLFRSSPLIGRETGTSSESTEEIIRTRMEKIDTDGQRRTLKTWAKLTFKHAQTLTSLSCVWK